MIHMVLKRRTGVLGGPPSCEAAQLETHGKKMPTASHEMRYFSRTGLLQGQSLNYLNQE